MDIQSLRVNGKHVEWKQSDLLKNSYELEIKDKEEYIVIDCEYQVKPILRFDNCISKEKTCIWGEEFIFTYIDYILMTKSSYKVEVQYLKGSILVGGEIISEKDEYIMSQIKSDRPAPLPLVHVGKYEVKKIIG